MFLLEIETANAAFADGNAGNEVSRILELAAAVIADRPLTSHLTLKLTDLNGNSCGVARYVDASQYGAVDNIVAKIERLESSLMIARQDLRAAQSNRDGTP